MNVNSGEIICASKLMTNTNTNIPAPVGFYDQSQHTASSFRQNYCSSQPKDQSSYFSENASKNMQSLGNCTEQPSLQLEQCGTALQNHLASSPSPTFVSSNLLYQQKQYPQLFTGNVGSRGCSINVSTQILRDNSAVTSLPALEPETPTLALVGGSIPIHITTPPAMPTHNRSTAGELNSAQATSPSNTITPSHVTLGTFSVDSGSTLRTGAVSNFGSDMKALNLPYQVLFSPDIQGNAY